MPCCCKTCRRSSSPRSVNTAPHLSFNSLARSTPRPTHLLTGLVSVVDLLSVSLSQGEMTNARRSSPVPQMSCKGGPCQYAPTTAMCRNIGFDGSDVTWKCEAELPKGVKFGKVEVSCEGHGSRDDEYVLKGSCGLEYQLVGEARFDSEVKEEDSWWNRNVRQTAGKHPAHRSQSGSSSWFTAPWNWLTGAQAAAADQYNHARDYAQHQYDKASHHMHHEGGQHHAGQHGGQHGAYYQQESTGLFGMLSSLVSTLLSMGVKLIAAAIVLFVLWRLMRPATSVQQPVAARRPGMLRSVLGVLPLFGGSGLSGVFDNTAHNANPPPYNPPPPPYDAAGFDKRYYSSAAQQQQAQQAQAQQAGGSGYSVLHGLLGGSLLGYFMGQRRANNQQQRTATYTQPPAAAYQQPSTVHHVHHNAPPAVNPAYGRTEQQRYPTATTHTTTRSDGATLAADGTSIEDVSDVRTTETSTAYARTKRR